MHKIGDDTPTANGAGEFQVDTDLIPGWLNAVQRELKNAINISGQVLDVNDDAQLSKSFLPHLSHLLRGLPFDDDIKITSADGANSDNFGYSTAISADGTMVIIGAYAADVGSNINQGAAYVFTRTAGVWSFTQKITASDGAASDRLGSSIDISSDGTTAIIGAEGGNGGAGAAYVYTLSGGIWGDEVRLVASDPVVNNAFGVSVSISSNGDTVLIGAYARNSITGAAYAFVRSTGVWSQQQILVASDAATGDQFGYCVALSADGNVGVVGALGNDIAANADQGAAYVFTRTGSVWTEDHLLTASDGQATDYFGVSCAISDDASVIAIGCWNDTYLGISNHGSIYVYHYNGSSYTHRSPLYPSTPANTTKSFGNKVSISGDGKIIAACCEGKKVHGVSDAGAVVLFNYFSGDWRESQIIIAGDYAGGDFFGASATLSKDGNTLVVGAKSDDIDTIINQGSAYIYKKIVPL